MAELRAARLERDAKVRASTVCPACKAALGEGCGIVFLESHLMQDMPDGTVHRTRVEAFERAEVEAML